MSAAPARRIVAASVLTGAVLAVALPLTAAAGAGEHAVTGWALVGLSLGWAMLAALSGRLTDRPQGWATVPAAASGATGLALLALTPDDRALTALGWVWPPLVLALAAWTGVRVRRLGPRSGRRLLAAVVAVMAAAALGGTLESVGLATDQRNGVMPGQTYDVGGRRLHLHCSGSGSPTVVLHGGLGEFSASWARVVPAVAGVTRVCSYDRAGQGWSDDAPDPQDGLAAAADLNTLLRRAGEDGPYVLVGHSIGGDHALTYASRHPEEVAGLVLLDATDPYRSTGRPGSAPARPPAGMGLLPSLARLGVGRLLPASSWSSLPQPEAGQVRAYATSPRGVGATVSEYAAIPALLGQARALTSLGSRPLLILTASGHGSDPGWLAGQERLAALSTNSVHRFADASHAGLLEEPGGAGQSARAVLDVVRAARTGSRVPVT